MTRYKKNGAFELNDEQRKLITPKLINTAIAFAAKYRHCCGGAIEQCDLEEDAMEGLCEAVHFHNAEKGASLDAYVFFYVRKRVLTALNEYGLAGKLDREDREQLHIIRIDALMMERVEGGIDAPEAEGYSEPEDDLSADELEAMYARLEELIAGLTQKEQQVVRLVHGLDCQPLTMKEAAKEMGITHERARQIYNRAISKMQLAVEE